MQLLLPPIGAALGSQRRSGGGQGTAISTPGIVLEHGKPACIGTHYTQRPHRCVRGAFKGAIASACGRASRPRSRPSAAPFLADGQDAVVDAKLLFAPSRKLSVRARGSQVRTSCRGFAFSFQSYEPGDSTRGGPP